MLITPPYSGAYYGKGCKASRNYQVNTHHPLFAGALENYHPAHIHEYRNLHKPLAAYA